MGFMEKNVVTLDLVKWAISVIAVLGACAGYIEFRSQSNDAVLKAELLGTISANKAELSGSIASKYDLQSGLKLEELLNSQKELIRLALDNQKEINNTNKELVLITRKLETQIDYYLKDKDKTK